MIARIGLIEEYIAQGLVARYVQFWDRRTLTKIAEFDHEILRDETQFPFVVQTEQHKLVVGSAHDGGKSAVHFRDTPVP